MFSDFVTGIRTACGLERECVPQPPHFSCFAKKSKQKKATQHPRPYGPLRSSPAAAGSETRRTSSAQTSAPDYPASGCGARSVARWGWALRSH